MCTFWPLWVRQASALQTFAKVLTNWQTGKSAPQWSASLNRETAFENRYTLHIVSEGTDPEVTV